jgi:hypothetical protein
MKKLFFILALTAVYAVSSSSVTGTEKAKEKQEITIVADTDDAKSAAMEEKKDKKKKKSTAVPSCCSQKETVKTGCSETQQKSCAASEVSCPGTDKKKEKK